MADFNALRGYDILFTHYTKTKDGKKKELIYTLDDQGQLRQFNDDDDNPDFVETNKINRGSLYLIYDALAEYAVNRKPSIEKPLNEEYLEIDVVGKDGNPFFVDPENGERLPTIVTLGETFYIRGLDFIELIHDWGERKTEQPLGKSFLEEFFDVRIPEGYEGVALEELRRAIRYIKDGKTKEEGEVFIDWLIHGKGLPPLEGKLLCYLKVKTAAYRENLKTLIGNLSREAAILRGCHFLRGRGENEEMYPMLKALADEKSAKGCELLARYNYEDGYDTDALKYAMMGASLGDGEACRLAAWICREKDDLVQTRLFLDMGIELDNGDCFGAMADCLMSHRDAKEGHPFYSKNSLAEAVGFALNGMRRHSAFSMLTLGKIASFWAKDQYAEWGLQLLQRAESLGSRDALYWLAEYYRQNHEYGPKKDLRLATVYIKKAIIEEARTPEACQLLYAEILLEKGKTHQGTQFLEELAQGGYRPAQMTLGEQIAKDDPPVEPKFPKDYYRALLWRDYPDIMSARDATFLLKGLARRGEIIAYQELERIYRDGPEDIKSEEKARHYRELFEAKKAEIPLPAEEGDDHSDK